MCIELKIKAMSLAEESRIIRREENKIKAYAPKYRNHKSETNRESIYLHRVQDVRNESRATHIARAFLKGKHYLEVEKTHNKTDDWTYNKVLRRALGIINKYGKTKISEEDFRKWVFG